MPRFVLLRHECPPSYKASHWDLMAERDGALLCWSLSALPCSWAEALGVEGQAAEVADAVRLPDHRLMYLDYEGPVSDDRGEVRRCDGGEFRAVDAGSSSLRVELRGAALKGLVLITLVDGDRWQVDTTPSLSG